MQKLLKYYVIYWMIISSAVILTCASAKAQVVYDSHSSYTVKHVVQTEKPVFKRDTLNEFGMGKIEISFTYKQFVIYIEGGEQIKLRVISGKSRVMLKPDDEYEIIEKLLTLIK